MKIIIADPNRLRAQAFSDLLLSFPELDLEIPSLCYELTELFDLVQEERPYLVFISIHFPKSIYDYVSLIRRYYQLNTLPVITGEDASNFNMRRAIDAGVFGIFISPIERKRLRATIRLLCSQIEQMRKAP